MKQQTINNLIASSNAVTSERKLSAMKKKKRDFEQYEAWQNKIKRHTQMINDAIDEGDDTGCY